MAAGPKTVVLISPDGGEVAVSTPLDVTNLVYGAGYKVKGKKSVEDAYAALAPNVPAEEPPAPPAADK